MLISSALARNPVAGTGSSGGATALTIIILIAVTALLIYVARNKWRKRKQLKRGDNGE